MNRRILSRLLSAGLIGLVLLAPDDGGAAGGAAPGAASGDAGAGGNGSPGGGDEGTAAGAATPPATDGQGGDGGNEQTVKMSQAEFEKLIDKRIGQARKGWEKDLGDVAAAENQTAEQQAVARAEKAEKDAAAAVEQANRTLVKAAATTAAVEAKARPDRVDALLNQISSALAEVDVTDGVPDAAAIKKAVEAGLNSYPEWKTTGAPAGASGGDMNQNGGTAKPTTLAEAIQQRIAAQSS